MDSSRRAERIIAMIIILGGAVIVAVFRQNFWDGPAWVVILGFLYWWIWGNDDK